MYKLAFSDYLCIYNMLKYPAKILIAFGEAIDGNDKIFGWLLKNGYPELAALAKAIRGSEDANQWLLKNKFPHFAAFDMAVVNDKKAIDWLKKYKFNFLLVLSEASGGSKESIRWLAVRNLHVFIRIAQKIKHFTDGQTFDYHKIHF